MLYDLHLSRSTLYTLRSSKTPHDAVYALQMSSTQQPHRTPFSAPSSAPSNLASIDQEGTSVTRGHKTRHNHVQMLLARVGWFCMVASGLVPGLFALLAAKTHCGEKCVVYSRLSMALGALGAINCAPRLGTCNSFR